jgi:signal transduction histidine kinase
MPAPQVRQAGWIVESTPKQPFQQSHILVVDDDRPMREILRRIIVSTGYHCITADGGENALAILEEQPMDVVVTDIRMYGISGIDLLRLVKQRYDSDVIAITGYTADYTYENIIELGASDFMIKPFSSKEFLLRLKRVINSRNLLSERNSAYLALREVSKQLIKAQEHERQRIARDLHDRVAQDLSALKISIDTLLVDQIGCNNQMVTRLSALARQLGKSIQSLREIAYNLRPPILDQLGLSSTAFQFGQEFSANSGIEVDFFSAGIDDLQLDADIQINLFRMIQEALTNVQRHAQAERLTIRLVASYPNILLRIEDNGVGFDVDERMGLNSMEERVSLLGGQMKIKSMPGRGTKILIQIPISVIPHDPAVCEVESDPTAGEDPPLEDAVDH